MSVVLMGVTGCGKTTVGSLLAKVCGWEFHDADDYHSAENVAKMKSGAPLTDQDRWPWLEHLNSLLIDSDRQGQNLVLACSALKQAYRDRLARGCTAAHFVFLDGDKDLIRARLAARKGHYMNPKLLDSQFAILERPQDALRLDAAEDPEILVRRIREALAV
ncbi:MAG: gluconokinase [Burkholderiales bacterium]|nr:gluconokinase [Burkholderiales bacterium]